MTDVVEPLVLAVDLGTGGPKTALVSMSGSIIGSVHRRVEPTVTPDGAATQDPEAWWVAVTAGIRELVTAHPSHAARLAAVAVTGQFGSTVPVDAGGSPVGEAMLWMDTRGRAHARRILGGPIRIQGFAPKTIATWIRHSGGVPSLDGNDPLGHRLWIEHEQPDCYRAAAAFIEPIDFITSRFTGRVVATQVSMMLSWLCDNRHLNNDRYDPTLVRLAAVDPARLPPLVRNGSVVGTVSASLRKRLGLPADLPVVNALPDLHTAALGSGTTGLYEPHLSISTSGWVGCHTPGKRTSIRRQMATVPSALPGKYILVNNHETAGVCLDWARSLLVTAPDGLTEPADSAFSALDSVAATAPSASRGVLFTPWLNGERSPVADADLRGGFHGLSLATTRADLIRSVLEGVAHNSRWLLEESEAMLGHPLSHVRAMGGGAGSDLWCQIHADVLGRPVHRVADPLMVNVRGATFFAGLVLGLIDVADIHGRVEIDRVFEPDAAAQRAHDPMHAEFIRLPRTQRAMFKRLRRARAA